ncbi:ABC transporter substrate-binding protein [Caproiciproducens galactitolivorans]|uniref:Leucine-, isoleucine-, valine-, threonine-, and alanine-binding protein n=1 Tax=Caproiciproducens galactitolivorans TaxID=642589 RepID=A0A4Z0YFV0_9FIRM|nr:ABC transporter substrate-binding protein [Caproiciproducens galactitolivorans]QEY34713.1 ABC transporter substrate-binding protein [Caproiciproducens galactitolivorans]TGJ75812.1 leucine-, isoleucine-, valine-, threonine-, and alanine-binding protein precursor [Caproiciproducens galactitolivorans]
MKKRLLAAALAATMVAASVTGCAQSGDSKGTGDAASGDTVKIGGLAPLTGNVSVYGIATNNGIKLAVDEINKAGGVLGKKIEYVPYDEKGDAIEAVNAYNKLVQDDKVVALIGDVTSKPTIAVAQKAVKDGLPMITATGTAADITKAGENVFRACFIDPYQGELMAAYAARKLNAKTAAIIYDNGDDYSTGVANAFEAAAKSEGITITNKEAYQSGAMDFKTQLTKIKASNPDVVMIPVYYSDVALIAVQAKDIGLKAKLLGADGWDGVLEKIDKSNQDAVKGCYFCSQYSAESTDPKLQEFLKKYKETYKTDPNMFAVLGYDAMGMMAAAINKAGSTDSDKIVSALKALEYKGLTGNTTFDENRNPVREAVITTISDGKYKFVENFKK